MRSILGKTILFTSTTLFVGLLIYQCFVSGRFFLSYPTFATSEFVDQKDAKLPDVSFCFEDRKKQTQNFEEYIWTKIEFIYARFFEINKETGLAFIRYDPEIDLEETKKGFIIRQHPKYGTCITYIHDEFKHLGLYYLRANLFDKANVFLHQRDSFWHSTTIEPGITIDLQTITQVQVLHSDIRTLPSDENVCSFGNHDECFEGNIKKLLTNETGCQPKDEIELENLSNCEDETLDKISQEVVNEALKSGNENECKVPCEFMDIRTGGRNFDPKATTRFYGYFPYKVPLSKESYFYTGLSMIAEVGGVAGLLLGVSFYHLARLIIFILDNHIEKMESKVRSNVQK